jgi:uncharacterized protein YuzE
MVGSAAGARYRKPAAGTSAWCCSRTERRFITPSSTAGFGRRIMKVKYFPDTDTLLMSFSETEIAETRDLNENVLVELDADGRVVSITIEHAKQQMDVSEFSYQLADI